MTKIANRNVLVLGLGKSGKAASEYLMKRGGRVTAVDANRSLLDSDVEVLKLRESGLKTLLEDQITDISAYDMVVVSPGISPKNRLYTMALELKKEIVGEIELALDEIAANPKLKCLAIGGTNGKTTVTSLVEHVLKHSGYRAIALGNIGTPLTTAMEEVSRSQEETTLVLELSSFQLETIKTPFIDATVLLNITPDHLDRYASMTEYAKVKISVQNLLRNQGPFFVEEKCYREFSSLFNKGNVRLYGYSDGCYAKISGTSLSVDSHEEILLPDSLQSKKSHDVENLMGAYLLCRERGVTSENFLKAFSTFKKPAHRIEFVKTVQGVHYYDDSKGTNIDAVIRAVDFFNQEIVLIAGGVDKGAPYTPWIEAFRGKVKAVCAIGEAAPKIARDLAQHMPVYLCKDLKEAVQRSSILSLKDGIVLLSPGCSSFDMFKDYAHRGQEFQRLVNAL